jgi:hypothetical protein
MSFPVFRCGPIAVQGKFSARLSEHSPKNMHLGSQQAKTKIPSSLAESNAGTYLLKLNRGIGESKRPKCMDQPFMCCVIFRYKRRRVGSGEAQIQTARALTTHQDQTITESRSKTSASLNTSNNNKTKSKCCPSVPSLSFS